jgi:hypothetical protein
LDINGDGDLPEVEKRVRTAKFKKIEESIGGLYIMGGGALSTLPEQVAGTRVKMIGLAIGGAHEEIAEAWTDLAEDDARVRKALESLTQFSGWGKVIGVHFMAIGMTAPGIAAVMPMPQQQRQQSQQQGAGMPEPDAQTAMLLGELMRMAQSEQRVEQEQRFPPETAPQPPQPQPQQQPVQQQRPAEVRPGRGVGMPSPADMGVSVADAPLDFPTGGPENIRG